MASIRQRLEEFYSVFHLITANIGNTSVYRVRKIEPNKEHNHFNDVWCPNSNDVKRIGRANDIGQSIFYGAFDPVTAIVETRIMPGEKYSLAVFRLKSSENHNSVVIRQAEHIEGSDPELSQYGLELSKFMMHEFTRIVPQGQEHVYRRSCAIAQLLLETPYKDSLVYPSAQTADRVNIALKPDAALLRLNLQQVLTCELTSEGEHRVLELKIPDTNGFLISHNLGFPLPNRLKFNVTPMSFSTTFLKMRIPTPGEMAESMMKRAAEKRALSSQTSMERDV